jgi:dTDP-4-amino-4,6-dideoxygalactose transaminase
MILMNNFQLESEDLKSEELNAIKRVIDSGWYILGPELEHFEKEWSSSCGFNYSLGVGNGMDAIEIALRSSGIGSGDEVITTPMTAFASVLAIIRAGATPVLADIEFDTGLLSRESVIRCITVKTRAVLLVHLYGQLRDMLEWQSLCKEHSLTLIEDCAQAHLSKYQGHYAGSFGITGAYSFYPTKNLGCLGDGGMLVTNSSSIAEKASALRNYGQSKRYYHDEIGLNSRLDEIQAAVLSVRLKWLPEFTKRRQEIAGRYRHEIKNIKIQHLLAPQDEKAHVYHLFVITSQFRDQLLEHLRANDIQSFIHYPVPVHQQVPCKDIARDQGGLRNAESHAANCLSLPCHPQMSDGDIDRVISVLNRF